jgi:hypothetical protein
MKKETKKSLKELQKPTCFTFEEIRAAKVEAKQYLEKHHPELEHKERRSKEAEMLSNYLEMHMSLERIKHAQREGKPSPIREEEGITEEEWLDTQLELAALGRGMREVDERALRKAGLVEEKDK